MSYRALRSFLLAFRLPSAIATQNRFSISIINISQRAEGGDHAK